MEGAGEARILYSVVLPEIKPLIAVIAIQRMIGSWNAFQWPLLVVNSDRLRTLPIAIAKLSSQYNDAYNLKMAAATVAIIPVILVYIFFQRYFVEGITLSGIK
jgi:multiple sugar transport system permease protein